MKSLSPRNLIDLLLVPVLTRDLLSLSRMDSTCRSAGDKSGLMNMFSLARKYLLAKMSYTSLDLVRVTNKGLGLRLVSEYLPNLRQSLTEILVREGNILERTVNTELSSERARSCGGMP